MPAPVDAGDVLLTRSATGVSGRLIRLGACLQDQPNTHNHVVVVHHVTGGVVWGVEGRPGGVGWVDCSRYLADRWTVTNAEQPKTERQRAVLAEGMLALLGRPYDYLAIGRGAAEALGVLGGGVDGNVEVRQVSIAAGVTDLWAQRMPPGHLICSAVASTLYDAAGLAHPEGRAGERFTWPHHWTEWCTRREWQVTV